MSTLGLLHLAAGALLTLIAWLLPRHVAQAGRAPLLVLLLDLMPIAYSIRIDTSDAQIYQHDGIEDARPEIARFTGVASTMWASHNSRLPGND